MKRILKKLDSRGVAHHALIAIIIVLGVAGFGAYRIYSSSAATDLSKYSVPITSEDGCKLAGRVWNPPSDKKKADVGSCVNECRAKDVQYVKKDKDRPGYCQGYVGLDVEKARCLGELHRYFIDDLGCARKANQVSVNDANACQAEFPNYLADNKVDRCTADTVVSKAGGQNPKPATPNNPGSGNTTPTQPVPQPATSQECELYGRRWDEAKKTCRPSCVVNGGSLLSDSVTRLQYCQNAVSKAGETSEQRCNELHRKWTAIGCARRVDQKDTLQAVQCLENYPYYNANFKSSNRELNIDICETDQQTALENELSGTLAGQPVKDVDGQGGGGAQPTTAKITLYENLNYQGKSLTVTKATASLPKEWNDKASSYRIESGRWQLCADREYKKRCIRPFVSDSNLADNPAKPGQVTVQIGLLNDEISSLRPMTVDETEDDVAPICKDGKAVSSVDGGCPAGSEMTCKKGYVLQQNMCVLTPTAPDEIVAVDASFTEQDGKRKCLLLGREWIGEVAGKTMNGGNYGCSMSTCQDKKDGTPKLKNGSENGYYCVNHTFDTAYAVRLASDTAESGRRCEALRRVWVGQVGLCAQVAQRRQGDQKIVGALQCAKFQNVYYIYKASGKQDECFSPSYFQRARSTAKAVGGRLAAALKQGPRVYCNTVKRDAFHWSEGECVADRKQCPKNGNGNGSICLPVKRPNIVFVLTDDQSMNLSRFMPKTNRLIAGEGMSFTNYFDNISLCCAARASIMRGQYAHNTKVVDNELPNGGFGKFYQMGEHKDNIATWLADNGYETSLMGKYINGYPSTSGSNGKTSVPNEWVPPGWSDWFSAVRGTPYKAYNYTMNENGKMRKYGSSPNDHMVDVISKRAEKYIRDRQSSDKPYFMYLSPYSPHTPATPSPRHVGSEAGLTYPQTEAFNESDVNDKYQSMRTTNQMNTSQVKRINDLYQRRAESMHGIDDMVANLYKTLEQTGQLDNTYIVYTSDNGFHMGEHRLEIGKYTPYETDIHLPLYIRGPGIKAGTTSSTLAGNIDLAQTFAGMAGASTPNYVDGQSLVPSLLGLNQPKRQYYLLERMDSKYQGVEDGGANGSPDEPPDVTKTERNGTGSVSPPPYQGLRSRSGYVYINYKGSFEEFYDINKDKNQLNNLLSPTANPKMTTKQRNVYNDMRKQLPKMSNCKKSSCIQ